MKLGSIATGDDFFDREAERADLWRYLATEHVIASGPRRLGKSSIVNRLCEEANEKGILAKHVDVQDESSIEGFIAQIEQAFPDTSVSAYLRMPSQAAKQWLEKVKKVELKLPGGIGGALELQAMAADPWRKLADALQKRLSAVPVLIMVDEFSLLLQKLLDSDKAQAEGLLAWMRAWRVSKGVACRFLITGSIGLNALLESYGMSAQFNDCFEYPIGPFKKSAAHKMLVIFANANGWEIIPEGAQHLSARVGWLSPFYLCVLLDQSQAAARDRLEELGTPDATKIISIQDIDDGYERLLSARSRFNHWEERLKRDLKPKDLQFTKNLLTFISKTQEGLTQRQLLTRLAKLEADPEQRKDRLQIALRKLQEEGYIAPPDAQSRSMFLSPLLRDYWTRNHA